MPLFMDGPACSVEDLVDQDSGLLDVAKTCGINVDTKIRLAHEEIATDLQLWLDRPRPSLDLVWGPILYLEQVVVTSPLKRWESLMSLSLMYRDAYFSQLVDRYKAKWEEYTQLASGAYDKFIASGLGLVADPVGRPAAPVLGTSQGPQKGGQFYAKVTWVNNAGQESYPSEASSLIVADGNLMTVSVAGDPGRAAGFNVYAGTGLDGLFLQNSSALPVNGVFTFVPGSVTQGRLPGNGQKPDFIRPLVRTWLRG